MDNRNYRDHAERAVGQAKKLGAHQAEVFLNNDKQLSIDVRDGQVETMKLAEERGLGVRLLIDGKIGFAFTSDLSPEAVEGVIEDALANAVNTSADKYRNFPGASDEYPQLDIYDPQIASTSVERKINMAQKMEDVARAYSPQIKVIESASYQDGETEVIICNSQGVSLSYRSAFCGLYIALVAGEGDDNQTGFDLEYGLRFSHLDPDLVGKNAARRAVRMLGARPVSSQQVPVVLDPYVAAGFLGVLGPSLTGEAVQKGRSLFAGQLGRQVASEKISIIDDGTLPGGIGSSPFDGEGYPTARTALIQSGFLQGFLHNTYTAAKDGVLSTGNGTRGSFKSTPEVGTTNFFIAPGDVQAEELVKDLASGFYVTEVMGLHTANPISGDFSLGAAGIWIENGAFAQPVKGVAVAGNIMDLLKDVDGVGDDLRFIGSRGAPTLRISSMSISGH